MSNPVFSERPTIALLQWLARGSLKQNLMRAMRLWVLLRFIYGKNAESTPFTYANWRDAFFSSNHPKGEEIPALHDPKCACAKTTASVLFAPDTGIIESQWRAALQAHDPITDLNELLAQRLFGVTRRSLNMDFQILVELGWLKRMNQKYYRIETFPNYPIEVIQDMDTEVAQKLRQASQFLKSPLAQKARPYLQRSYQTAMMLLDELDQEPISSHDLVLRLKNKGISIHHQTIVQILRALREGGMPLESDKSKGWRLTRTIWHD